MFGVKNFEIYKSNIVMSTYEASNFIIDGNGNNLGVINAITKTDENFNSIWKTSFKNWSTFDFIMTLSDESNVFVVVVNTSLITWFYQLDFITGQLILSKCNQYLESNATITGLYFYLLAFFQINSEYLAIEVSNISLGVNYLIQSKN